MAVFFIAFFAYFISTSLLYYTSPPFFLHIFIFIFISWYWQVNAILRHGRGGYGAGSNERVLNIVAINSFFSALGWEIFVELVE